MSRDKDSRFTQLKVKTKLDLTGQKFSRLTVISEAPPIKGDRAWFCKCDCDSEKIITIKQEYLRNGNTKSCGCLNDESRRSRAKKMYLAATKFENSTIASANTIWRKRYKDGNISFDDFLILSKQNCYYCGEEPIISCEKENSDYIYNGLDRINNDLPHNLDNVVPCCKYCNYAKRERSLESFEQWIKNLYENFVKVVDKHNTTT